MAKKLGTLSIAVALIGAALLVMPARAATEVPATVQVTDPVDDANFLNDQDNAYGTPGQGEGDHGTPADAGSATDFLKIWYTNDPTNLTLHVQTQAAPDNLAEDVYFRIASNPGEGAKGANADRGCIYWTALLNGAAGGWTGDNTAQVVDSCNVGDPVDAQMTIETLADDSGIISITVPRAYSPLFADGKVLTQTYGVARVLVVGPSPQTATAVTSDTTQRGSDYSITAAPKCKKTKKKKTCPKPVPVPTASVTSTPV